MECADIRAWLTAWLMFALVAVCFVGWVVLMGQDWPMSDQERRAWDRYFMDVCRGEGRDER